MKTTLILWCDQNLWGKLFSYSSRAIQALRFFFFWENELKRNVDLLEAHWVPFNLFLKFSDH